MQRSTDRSHGKFWKARDELYYHSRVTGVEMQPLQPGEWPSILRHQQERHQPEFSDFYAIYDQLGNIPRPGVVLQIDDPGLADKFGMFYPPITIGAFRKHAEC